MITWQQHNGFMTSACGRFTLREVGLNKQWKVRDHLENKSYLRPTLAEAKRLCDVRVMLTERQKAETVLEPPQEKP